MPNQVLVVFGTRPEVIKLAPVIRQLEALSPVLHTITVSSSQHTDLLQPFVRMFGLQVDYDLHVMRSHQTPSQVCARVLSQLDPVLVKEKPDLILVQGDTSTALAAALAGFHRHIPVGHVEAGLRSGNAQSPFPEEMNRRLISQLATLHFAATKRNRDNLLAEGISAENIYETGNPVVDALKWMIKSLTVRPPIAEILQQTEGFRRLVVTTHRRESFGEVMARNLSVLRRFVDQHPDVALLFPVHPNPEVALPARKILGNHSRIHLLEPLNYEDFIVLLSNAWLIVSDSGGVQEEAPTLGKPLLILRENTERPEALEAGSARLVGGKAESLERMLRETHQDTDWIKKVQSTENPFGKGDSGVRIAQAIVEALKLQGEPTCVSQA